MNLADIPHVWIAIAAGIIFWWIGQQLRRDEMLRGQSVKAGVLLSYLGLVLLGIGLYAGFRGPVTLGGVTLEPFTFTQTLTQVSNEATAYAAANLSVSRTPAPTWQGASKDKLEYAVRNNGKRKLSRLMLRLSTTDGASVELPLNGPFPPGKLVKSVIHIPDNVSRAYFVNSGSAAGDIAGARF